MRTVEQIMDDIEELNIQRKDVNAKLDESNKEFVIALFEKYKGKWLLNESKYWVELYFIKELNYNRIMGTYISWNKERKNMNIELSRELYAVERALPVTYPEKYIPIKLDFKQFENKE